ncbi:MAG TPA: right-handed parallel beta-helix repeat-containing protein [Labilithrix sp.]|nr:right-handed parallel beta-helix repeat-containing protein [Labilithrix sp.]
MKLAFTAIVGLLAFDALACSSCGGPSAGPPPAASPTPSTDAVSSSEPPSSTATPVRPTGTSVPAVSGPPGPCVAMEGRKQFDVGDDKEYKTLAAVPWNRMGWGDAVRIFWRPQPYKEKIAIIGAGTAKAPLRICGVPGPKGELPIIDGENATTGKTASFYHPVHERRGVVTITTPRNDEKEKKPHHVVVEGLEIRNAGQPLKFTDSKGASQEYFDNGACIFVERGEDITLRNNDVHHCANGIFVASGGGEDVVSRRILIEGNYLHDNGSTGNRKDRHHNAYTEALGIVYQFNRFGPIREGSEGIQLKDRSTGNVVRYNWFEGGKRVLDLVEPEESEELAKKEAAFNRTYVYGNVIILGKDASSRVVHYGGDNGDTNDYRKGTLYFYDNTVSISTSSKDQWNIALINLENAAETADVRNNVIYSSNDANVFWLFEAGTLKLGTNWATQSIKLARHQGAAKLEHVYGSEKTILGAGPPGFVDEKAGDFCLAKSSPARGVAGELAKLPNDLLPTHQYKKHRGQAPRPAGSKDLGAIICD